MLRRVGFHVLPPGADHIHHVTEQAQALAGEILSRNGLAVTA